MVTTDLEPVTETSLRAAWRQRLGRWDVKASPYLYVAPFFIVFAVFGMFPIVYTAVISLMDWDTIRNSGEFIGFDNFMYVLQDRKFWYALRNTFSIFLLSSIPQLLMSTFIAAMLDHHLRGRTFWRMGVLVPYVVMPVAVGIIFSKLFADESGVFNHWLGMIGIDPIGWHKDVLPSHFAIATMVNFRWTGYNALILLAAMQAIPRDLYEAAAIDGASAVRRFVSVTIPQIRPTMIFVIITATIGGLQIFDEPRMFDTTGTGGADQQWLTITMYMYNVGFGTLNFGRASAIAWLLFLIIVVFSLINLLVTRRLIKTDSGGIL